MRAKSKLPALVPLGVGLLVFVGLTLEPPGAEKRPAPSVSMTVNGDPVELERVLDIEAAVASIEIEPARVVYLETVVLQGGVGDRKAAILELRNIGNSDAIAALSMALSDEDQRVRKAALEALSRIGSDEALAALASAATGGDARMRARAAEALADSGAYSAADYLELVLRDPDPRVRDAATEALGDIGDSRALNIISAALRDPDIEVRRRAAQMLDQLDDEALFHAVYPAN